jgi:DNA-binding XRE family transcriptional regulator
MALTAAELGELLELRPETISRIENGKMPVDRRTVALLRCARPRPETQSHAR